MVEGQGWKIFLKYAALITGLGLFNLYYYWKKGLTISLVMLAACALALIGWTLFYLLYVRRKG